MTLRLVLVLSLVLVLLPLSPAAASVPGGGPGGGTGIGGGVGGYGPCPTCGSNLLTPDGRYGGETRRAGGDSTPILFPGNIGQPTDGPSLPSCTITNLTPITLFGAPRPVSMGATATSPPVGRSGGLSQPFDIDISHAGKDAVEFAESEVAIDLFDAPTVYLSLWAAAPDDYPMGADRRWETAESDSDSVIGSDNGFVDSTLYFYSALDTDSGADEDRFLLAAVAPSFTAPTERGTLQAARAAAAASGPYATVQTYRIVDTLASYVCTAENEDGDDVVVSSGSYRLDEVRKVPDSLVTVPVLMSWGEATTFTVIGPVAR